MALNDLIAWLDSFDTLVYIRTGDRDGLPAASCTRCDAVIVAGKFDAHTESHGAGCWTMEESQP